MTERDRNMTETAASKGPVRLLHECARLAGFDPATGWPDELPFKGVVNILAGEWKLSDAGRKEWARMLSAAIKPGGGLTTIEKVTTVQPLPRGIGRRLSQNSTWNHWAHGREPEMLYMPAPETRVSYYVTRAALAAWLRAIGETAETLSPCALRWLGDEWQPAQEPETGTTGKPGGKVEAKKDTIRAILAAIKKLDPEFLPEAMPGQKADFFALCREYDPQAFKTVTLDTFDGYLSGLCKFGQGARPSDYYREIAPRIGVKRIKSD